MKMKKSDNQRNKMAPAGDARRDRIFDLIVSSYIETAEPVGSRTLSRRSNLGLSSASIRNVMADLEEEGYLQQPHTSSGRVPTDKGYRYWVDSLMRREELNETQKDKIRRELGKAKTILALAQRLSSVISEITENATLFYVKSLKRVSFLNYLLEDLIEAEKLTQFLEEEPEIFIEGAARVLIQPEFRDLAKMRHLLQAFEEKLDLLQILVGDLELEGVRVHIGKENAAIDLEEVSLVVKDCYLGQMAIGGVAVVGPKRMKYSKMVPLVEFVADSVTEAVQRL